MFLQLLAMACAAAGVLLAMAADGWWTASIIAMSVSMRAVRVMEMAKK